MSQLEVWENMKICLGLTKYASTPRNSLCNGLFLVKGIFLCVNEAEVSWKFIINSRETSFSIILCTALYSGYRLYFLHLPIVKLYNKGKLIINFNNVLKQNHRTIKVFQLSTLMFKAHGHSGAWDLSWYYQTFVFYRSLW